LLLAFFVGTAQGQSTLGEARRQVTRTELEKIAEASQAAAAAASDARLRAKYQSDYNAIRQRLQNGDFLPGDRIRVTVLGDSVLSDTFTVRLNRVLKLPGLPDLSLQGILDSELTPFLSQELSKYLKSPQVTATGLLRVSVLGAVLKPGFLTVPIDQALTDVIMLAGGPGAQADFDRAFVRRGSETLIERRALNDALRFGKTVGDVGMRDGDEILIPDKPSNSRWGQFLAALGAAGTLLWVFRR
jgi:polysaccharide export outer membrane protein